MGGAAVGGVGAGIFTGLVIGTSGAIIPISLAGGAMGYVWGSTFSGNPCSPSPEEARAEGEAPQLAEPLARPQEVGDLFRKELGTQSGDAARDGVVPRVVPKDETSKKRPRSPEPPPKPSSRSCGFF